MAEKLGEGEAAPRPITATEWNEEFFTHDILTPFWPSPLLRSKPRFNCLLIFRKAYISMMHRRVLLKHYIFIKWIMSPSLDLQVHKFQQTTSFNKSSFTFSSSISSKNLPLTTKVWKRKIFLNLFFKIVI